MVYFIVGEVYLSGKLKSHFRWTILSSSSILSTHEVDSCNCNLDDRPLCHVGNIFGDFTSTEYSIVNTNRLLLEIYNVVLSTHCTSTSSVLFRTCQA
mmetsp:Transcript_53303/g.113243  ORF Transcript_53303/g.113243 Transcript_53303/m.113243 type:complete len:97 (-) Transcript_53303:142-432(-)